MAVSQQEVAASRLEEAGLAGTGLEDDRLEETTTDEAAASAVARSAALL